MQEPKNTSFKKEYQKRTKLEGQYIGWFSQEEFHRAIQLVSAWEPGIDNFRPSGNTIPQDRHAQPRLLMHERAQVEYLSKSMV